MKKISLFLLLLLLTGCATGRKPPSSYPEHSYDEVSFLKIDYKDCFNQTNQSYLLYFYQETCHDCSLIKNEVIDFALNNQMPIYFIEANNSFPYRYSYNEIDKTIGATKYTDIWVGLTPEIVTINNYLAVDNKVGSNDVSYVLSTYRK